MKVEEIRDVFPGDKIDGRGSLGIHGDRTVVAGKLMKANNHLFVHSRSCRYRPLVDDIVIGRAIYTSADFHKLDIGGMLVTLPALSFANATKRNKPEVSKGDYLLCRVVRNGPEPLVTCAGEGFGKLNGTVLPLDSWRVRELYMGDRLGEIGKKYKFRIAMGLNGMVWIDGERDTDIRDIYWELKNM
jgi:exosome complex component RRP40